MGLVLEQAPVAGAEVNVKGLDLARLEIAHEEELVPDAVFIQVVELVRNEVAVCLLEGDAAPDPLRFLLGGVGLGGKRGVDDEDIGLAEAQVREFGAGDDDRAVWAGHGERVRHVDPDAVGGREVPLGVPARDRGGRAGIVDDPDVPEKTRVGAVARTPEPQAHRAAAEGRLVLVLALADGRPVDFQPQPVIAAAELDVVPGFGSRDVFGLGKDHVARLFRMKEFGWWKPVWKAAR